MNHTRHAHFSTTVGSTWQQTRALTYFTQNSPQVFQNRLLKFEKSLYLFFFLQFTNSSSEIKKKKILLSQSFISAWQTINAE